MTAQRKPVPARALRQRAESRLAVRKPGEGRTVPQDPRRLVHELEVHQVELTMQNEELQAARRELEAGLARYTELFDFAPIGYFVLTRLGNILDLNLAAARLLGSERQRLVGTRLALFVAEEHRGAFTGLLEELSHRDTGHSATRELFFSARDGARRDVIISAGAVRHPAFATLLAAQDVTERRRAEREAMLKRRFEILDRLSFALNRKLAQEDAPSLRDLLQEVVDQARLACGAEYAALGIGEDPERPFDPWVCSGLTPAYEESIGRLPRPVGLLGDVIRAGRSIRLRDVAARPSFRGVPPHHPVIVSFLGVAVPGGGKPFGHLYLANKTGAREFSDDDQTTVEMLAQRAGIVLEAARLSAELKAAMTARDNLLAVVAHDLRSPLTAIHLGARLLLMQEAAHSSDHDQSTRQLELLVRSSERMRRLIDELLQAATIEMRTFTVEAHTEPLAAMMEQAVAALQPAAALRSVRLEQAIAPQLPPARCDRPRIEQVLANLLENALKFVPDGGSIRVSASPAVEGLEVTVSDDGPGIPAADLPHLFERYWKGKGNGRHGAGLGLYITRGIIEAHGGRVWVESQPGRGASFHFTLPAAHDA